MNVAIDLIVERTGLASTLLAVSTTSLKRLEELRASLEAKRSDAGP